MTKHSSSIQLNLKGFKSKQVIKRCTYLFLIILVLNFSHNWRVAGENTSRNFQYQAWQVLTKDSNLFREVRNADIFISSNQNDAFETNAGSFYANTGIRLAYLFNTNSIFPNYSNCGLGSGCSLSGLRKNAIATIPNLTRGAFVPKGFDKKRIDDWVAVNSKPGALEGSKIWAFDIFLMTPTTYIGYLAPFLDNELTATIDFSKLRLVTITSSVSNEFSPAIDNVCLVQSNEQVIRSNLRMTYWKVPKVGKSPAGDAVNFRDVIDFRSIQLGTCAIS